MWVPTGLQWLPVMIGVIIIYEIVRSSLVVYLRRRYEAHVDRFLRQNDIPTDTYRHTHRVVVKERVLDEPSLRAAIEQRAASENRTVHDVEVHVRRWLDEIVPQFNILAYYQIGYRIARTTAYTMYNVRIDQESLREAQAAIPPEASVVYVSNHRSNADYVVTGFMLSKSVQVSYAVGEWARVWPLERLFKSFGSYFVRRGEKDPLYHQTLETYLQLITKQGVTQAMFPEGGLSRDGSLRPAKLGLLDHMTRSTLDPTFNRPLVFVPVGINFDRVIEDENLTREKHGEEAPRRSLGRKAWRLATLLAKAVFMVPMNIGRFFAKRLKKHGVVAIHFGQPIDFRQWASEHKPLLSEPNRTLRLASLQPFSDLLLEHISRNIPVTPVTLVCAAMSRIGQTRMEQGVDRATLILEMRAVHDAAAAAGAPMAIGDPYDDEDEDGVPFISAAVDDAETLAQALEFALDVTSRRRTLFRDGDLYRTQRWDLVEYYANSLEQYVEPESTPTQSSAPTVESGAS